MVPLMMETIIENNQVSITTPKVNLASESYLYGKCRFKLFTFLRFSKISQLKICFSHPKVKTKCSSHPAEPDPKKISAHNVQRSTPINAISRASTSIHQPTMLLTTPITPYYTQSPPTTAGTATESIFAHAILFTLAFTLFVYLFETYLDLRQRSSYFRTDFPKELEETVRAIDSEDKPTTDKTGSDNGNATTTDDNADDDNKKDKVDKSRPLLPQLQSKFSNAQSYGLDKITFSIVSSFYSLCEECVFLLLGFYPFAWDKAVEYGSKLGYSEESNEIKISLIFLGLTVALGTVTSLPFELYSTFRIEKKHGFNKQTIGLFISDKIKGLILTAVIGGPFVALLLKIIDMGGPHFYMYVWAFVFAFSVFMMSVYPVLIMPMFNKYEALPEGELKERIYALAAKLEFPLTKLFVMDGSKRSSHSNAFMFGFFKNKR